MQAILPPSVGRWYNRLQRAAFVIRAKRILMLFVIKKRDLQYAISVVRDDRYKRNHPGSFVRLEARHDYLSLSGWEASAQIAATVYEPGVEFLRVKLLRLYLPTIKKLKFLEVRITRTACRQFTSVARD